MKRNRQPHSPLARRLRRLGLNLADAARITRAPYDTLRGYHSGRTTCPRPVLRLLAWYRLSTWGQR